MCFRSRLIVIAVLAATAVAFYSASSYYSVSMITYVVEQALLQKLPPGADAKTVQSRLRTSLAVLPDREAKLKKLLFLSQYLEKLQKLTPRELDELLTRDWNAPQQVGS